MLVAATMLTAVLAGPALPVGDIFPNARDFRSQEIQRIKGEDWPFTAEKGTLVCTISLKKPSVLFVPKNAKGEDEYPFALADDMMVVAVVNLGRQAVLRPYDNFEQLFKRLWPYLSMGKRLCNQPPGTKLPDSAL